MRDSEKGEIKRDRREKKTEGCTDIQRQRGNNDERDMQTEVETGTNRYTVRGEDVKS